MNNNFFSGEDGLFNYLEPKREKMIPLVELPASLNPFAKYDIHICAKLMNSLPLMNVKSLPAWYMSQDASGRARHLVESSSGNTVASMGLLKDHFGFESVKAIVSNDVTDDKLAFLRVAGLDIEFVESPICPDPRDPNGPINQAKTQGERENWNNPGQYDNPHNPQAHYEITGPQIIDQVGTDNLAFFAAGLGTTGTFTGASRYVKEQAPATTIIGAVRAPNNPVPGVRTRNQLAEIDFDWQDYIDKENIFKIGERDSYLRSLEMIRKGLLVGPSAGFALSALLAKLELLESSGEIENYRGKYAVFICPDSPLLYVNDYEKVLGPGYFGQKIGLDLAKKTESKNTIDNNDFAAEEIQPEELLEIVRGNTRDINIIDVRSDSAYQDHHIDGSVNIELDVLSDRLSEFDHDKPTYFVCARGVASAKACKVAESQGVKNSKSLAGGMIRWSELDYPRVKDPVCR